MPYRQVFEGPERFMEHKGVKVYHRYHDDDAGQGPMDHWFTTSYTQGDGSGFNFDVRDLAEGRPVDSADDERRIIADAIDRGLLKVADDNSETPDSDAHAVDHEGETQLAPFPTPDMFNHWPAF